MDLNGPESKNGSECTQNLIGKLIWNLIGHLNRPYKFSICIFFPDSNDILLVIISLDSRRMGTLALRLGSQISFMYTHVGFISNTVISNN